MKNKILNYIKQQPDSVTLTEINDAVCHEKYICEGILKVLEDNHKIYSINGKYRSVE